MVSNCFPLFCRTPSRYRYLGVFGLVFPSQPALHLICLSLRWQQELDLFISTSATSQSNSLQLLVYTLAQSKSRANARKAGVWKQTHRGDRQAGLKYPTVPTQVFWTFCKHCFTFQTIGNQLLWKEVGTGKYIHAVCSAGYPVQTKFKT